MNILNRLTIKHLKMNKKRTIVTIIGVILSSALLFGVGLTFSTYQTNNQEMIIREEGSQHVSLKHLTHETYQKLMKKNEIKIISKEILLGSIEKHVTIHLYGRDDLKDILTVTAGRLPKTEQEIIISKDSYEDQNVKLQDKITINEQEYQIVGIYIEDQARQYQYRNGYSYQDNYAYTIDSKIHEDIHVQLQFKNVKDVYSKIEDLAISLGLEPEKSHGNLPAYQNMRINTRLLGTLGELPDDGQQAIQILFAFILLSVFSFVCIFVIYNAFAISVSERKKTLSIFSSIGATPKQILASVFYEAFCIGCIAIPIGFCLSIVTIEGCLFILNHILNGIVTVPYHLSINGFYLLLSLLFIVITLFLSAFFPAMRARETSPIQGIQSQDIHMKGKNEYPFIRRLFGFEGELAYKNMKRNKRKYRITIFSLCTSIVLFITISTFINYQLISVQENQQYMTPESSITIPIQEKTPQIIEELTSLKQVKKYLQFQNKYTYYEPSNFNLYTQEYRDKFLSDNRDPYQFLSFYLLDDSSYTEYKNKIGLKGNQPILYNQGKKEKWSENSEMNQIYEVSVFEKNNTLTLPVCPFEHQDNKVTLGNDCTTINNFYFTNISPFEDYYQPTEIGSTIVLNQTQFESILNSKEEYTTLLFRIEEVKSFDKEVKKILNKYSEINVSYQNEKLNRYDTDMMLYAMQFAMYAIIFFITLIGVTSVFNTIYTSMQLRRKEFAILRSVGLSPKGFRKMIWMESIFFGLKSLFYGLVISLFLFYWITQITKLDYSQNPIHIPFPTIYVIICIVSVFIIVVLTMYYATKKLKRENIIDAIEEENM